MIIREMVLPAKANVNSKWVINKTKGKRKYCQIAFGE